MEKQEKFETCRHVESVGSIAIYTYPTCPMAVLIKGRFVSSKGRCRHCKQWKGKQGV